MSDRVRIGAPPADRPKVDESAAVDVVGIRVSAGAVTDKPGIDRLRRAPRVGGGKAKGWREVYFAEIGKRVRTPIYERQGLSTAELIEGPAVIEEFGATTVRGALDRMTVGRVGEMVIEVGEGG